MVRNKEEDVHKINSVTFHENRELIEFEAYFKVTEFSIYFLYGLTVHSICKYFISSLWIYFYYLIFHFIILFTCLLFTLPFLSLWLYGY